MWKNCEKMFPMQVLCICLSWGVVASAMEFKMTNASLPIATYDARPVYDGLDSIYVIGGRGDNRIFKYSLSSDSVNVVGNVVDMDTYSGEAFMFGDEIIYFAVESYSSQVRSEVYSFSTKTNTSSVVAHLPTHIRVPAVAWNADSGIAYIFGGQSDIEGPYGYLDRVLEYDVKSQTIVQVAHLPEPRLGATAVWDPDRHIALIFGGEVDGDEGDTDAVFEYDPITKEVTRLPFSLAQPSASEETVWVDGKAYIYDAVTREVGPIGVYPSLSRSEIVPVSEWPPEIQRSGAVYVPKSRRTYLFGGFGQLHGEISRRYHEEVMYIQH